MSLRTFIRRFIEATESPPGEWLVAERIEEVKRQLSTGRFSIEVIAGFVGMGTTDTVQNYFKKRAGIDPREYRAHFSSKEQARRSGFAWSRLWWKADCSLPG